MNANEPAYPIAVHSNETYHGNPHGFTKREVAAVAIAAGIVSKSGFSCLFREDQRNMAKGAVEIADALIAELERTQQ